VLAPKFRRGRVVFGRLGERDVVGEKEGKPFPLSKWRIEPTNR